MAHIDLSHYAFLQSGDAIYGVGSTEPEARYNAMIWLRDNTDESSPGMQALEAPYCETLTGAYQVDGALCVVRCTKPLHDEVQANGPCAWEEDPEHRGICLPKELDEEP